MTDEEPSILRFNANRDSAESDERVRCPRCGKWIYMHDTRCEHCGLHFQGEAWEFSPSTRGSGSSALLGMPRWLVVAIAVLLLIAIALTYK
jgi:hypothetical protein